MEQAKRMKIMNEEIIFPEAITQHIQSFMSIQEAARTSLISKSWYNAWLTRPNLEFNDCISKFCPESPTFYSDFANFAKKAVQRYRVSSIKIETFVLQCYRKNCPRSVVDLIADAIEIGAKDVDIRFLPLIDVPPFVLPQEVLGSHTLTRLAMSWCNFDSNYIVSCSRLKTLTLYCIKFEDNDVFKDIITCCISMEELDFTYCTGDFVLSRNNLYELHKLRRLYLNSVRVDAMFFNDGEFASRFPCLKDLSICICHGCERIDINATAALQTIALEPRKGTSWRAKFDVPGIQKFSYVGSSLPSKLSIKGGGGGGGGGASKKYWDLDITICCGGVRKYPWFLKLKRSLAKFRLSSIISLSIRIGLPGKAKRVDVDAIEEAMAKPLVVENLTVINAQPWSCCAHLVRLFGICRPKLLTHYWASHYYPNWYGDDWMPDDEKPSVDILCENLMHQLIAPNWGVPDQTMFGRFGLAKVYKMFDNTYDILETKRQFELIWRN